MLRDHVRESLDEAVFVANLAALVLSVLLRCGHFLGSSVLLKGNLFNSEQ